MAVPRALLTVRCRPRLHIGCLAIAKQPRKNAVAFFTKPFGPANTLAITKQPCKNANAFYTTYSALPNKTANFGRMLRGMISRCAQALPSTNRQVSAAANRPPKPTPHRLLVPITASQLFSYSKSIARLPCLVNSYSIIYTKIWQLPHQSFSHPGPAAQRASPAPCLAALPRRQPQAL